LQINENWGGTNPEKFTIRGTYPSITLRSTNADNNWLIHNDTTLSFYSAAGVDSDSWGLRMRLDSDGVLKLNGHIVLNAGNYASYSPTLTGYGASGTWGIDISGASNRTYRAIIEDTRSGQRTPNDYEDYRTSWEFTNQIASGWRTAMTMQGWHDGYAAWQIIGPADTSANETWYLRSGVNTTWNPLRTIIHSGNIGAQSVTYADNAGLLNALSSYVWNNASAASDYHNGISASFVSSAQGFPSYGSVMTVRTYSGAMGTLQLYTPYSPTYGGYRLGYRSSNYDTGTWDGWKYLLNSVNDPYAYNMNQNVRTDSQPTFADVYTSGWFRNSNNNQGLYSQANNVHFYSSTDGYWNMGAGGRGNGGLVFRQDHQTTIKGYVYWDGDGFGLLNNQGGWSVRAFYGTGYGGELRGTWYTGDLFVGTGGSSTITMKDSDEGNREIHCNSNRIGFLNQYLT